MEKEREVVTRREVETMRTWERGRSKVGVRESERKAKGGRGREKKGRE